MIRSLAFPHLTLLFISYRLAVLLLYRPGGLIEPLSASPYYFLLNFFPAAPPLLAPILGGLLILPFEVATLYGIAWLTRRAGQPDSATERAQCWALSPLSLWAYLTGNAPVYTALLLAAIALLRQGRRTWLIMALLLLLGTFTDGANSIYPAMLLPLILLLVPDPGPISALFSAGVLLAGPFAAMTEADGMTLQALQALRWVGVLPSVIELFAMIVPVLGWDRWRERVWRGASLVLTLLSIVALFGLLPRQLRSARLTTASLAPALAEMNSAPAGWFISDSHDLWEQAVALGVGSLNSRVVTSRNVPLLRELLAVEGAIPSISVPVAGQPAPIWLLDSGNPEASPLIESLTEHYFVGDSTPLADGSTLRRFISSLPPDTSSIPYGVAFEDNVTLATARIGTVVRAGSLLAVELNWADNPGNAKIFLHLVNSEGTIVAQRDVFPQPAPDRHAISIPVSLLPGNYSLILGRYDTITLRRLALSRGSDTIQLQTVEVRK